MTRAKGWRQYLSIGLGLILGIACVAADSWASTSKSTITFDNQSGELALVKLVEEATGQAVMQIEVPTGEKRTLPTGGGDYYILTRYGNDPAQYRYSKGDPFTITETATKFSETTITLHKVIHGNYHTGPSSKNEFETAGLPSKGG